jgi:hypothetical protein
MAGVFTTFYAPPTHNVVCAYWERRDLLTNYDDVLAFMTEHWKFLPISGARRTNAFSPKKATDTLRGYAEWLESGALDDLPRADFETCHHAFLKGIPNHGRYTGLKLYETLRRLGADLPVVDNLVPKGGKTPRKGLALIYPGHDYRDNGRWACREANELADGLRQAVGTTWFNVEMLLCNFTKCVKGSYYPGHALDRDLSRMTKMLPYWGDLADIREQRARLYPRDCLGELRGWDGTRKDCERAYPDRGYIFSDLRGFHGFDESVLTPVLGFGEETP